MNDFIYKFDIPFDKDKLLKESRFLTMKPKH